MINRLLLGLLIVNVFVIFSCVSETIDIKEQVPIKHDAHVHIMSPDMVEDWKALGIPFSKSNANYSNIDTILVKNGAETIDLIGMGYIYSNPEFYQGDDQEKRLIKENNFLYKSVHKNLERIKPFYTINPLSAYAIEELNRCIDSFGMKGLKMHFSSSQIYLTEPEHLNKVKEIFEIAAENEVAVLLHFDNWHPKFGARDLNILNDSILRHIPAIELRIAHFGTSGGFTQKTKDFLDAFLVLKDNGKFSEKHRILLDISAVALDKDSEGVSKLTAEEFKVLKEYIARIGEESIIFATDYPLYNAADYTKILSDKLSLDVSKLYRPIK